MIDFLVANWWLAILLWAALFFSDFYLTMAGARAHKNYASQFITYQFGYELNPTWEKEVARFQRFSWKQVLIVVCMAIVLGNVALLKVPFALEFLIGVMLLSSIYINLRHMQNLMIFYDLRRPGAASGKIEYSYWFSQRASGMVFFSQAVLTAVAALATGRAFFWGGVLIFVMMTIRSYFLARRKFTKTSPIQ